MEENYLNFLSLWNKIVSIGAIIFLILGFLIFVVHSLRILFTRDLKKRFDYLGQYEITLLYYSSLCYIVAGVLYLNSVGSYTVSTNTIWFFVRVFVTVSFGIICGIIIANMLKVYYPFYLEKKLNKLRYKPRISPKTGKLMKLLSEEEEDVHLDEGMQAEENVFSVDYDVWIDEETGYKKIEKYKGNMQALKCDKCNYQTLKVVKEEIIDSPTTLKAGELIKFYQCSYCNYKARKTFKIAKITEVEDK